MILPARSVGVVYATNMQLRFGETVLVEEVAEWLVVPVCGSGVDNRRGGNPTGGSSSSLSPVLS